MQKLIYRLKTIVFGITLVILVSSCKPSSMTSQTSQQDEAEALKRANRVHFVSYPFAGFGPIFVGLDQGFFGDLDLHVHMMERDFSTRSQAFHQIDLTHGGGNMIWGTTTEAFSYERHRGIYGTIFLASFASRGADAIIARKPLASLENLKGKEIVAVGSPSITASHYFLHQALQSRGLSMKDVELGVVDHPEMLERVFNTESLGVNVAVSWEPILSKYQKKPYHILATTKDFPDAILGICLASQELKERPDLMKKFIQGWFHSVEFIEAHPQEAQKIMARGFDLSRKKVKIKASFEKGGWQGVTDSDFEGWGFWRFRSNSDEMGKVLSGLYFFDRKECSSLLSEADHKGLCRIEELIEEAGIFWESQGTLARSLENKSIFEKINELIQED